LVEVKVIEVKVVCYLTGSLVGRLK